MPDPRVSQSGVLAPLRARCFECKSWFQPSPRLKLRQKTCREVSCQRRHRARYQRKYRRANPNMERECREKIKSNRPLDFWKNYRTSHPLTTERNRNATKLRKRLRAAGLQRKLDIVQVVDPPGYFDLFQQFATSHRSLIHASQGTCAA
jgi:hypothetical protein